MSKFSSLRTSAAGSYLGLYVLSAFTTGMFVCVLLYHYFTESLYFDQYSSGDLTHIYTTITWVCMGWLMCLIAGIGFDILPLIHGTTPFHENAMRQFLITNLAGQSVLAISTFMNTEQKMLEFATVGISFLCLSILLLGGPGRRMFKESKRRKEEDEVGIASLIPGVAFPFFGATILACWLYRDIAGMLELGRSIMIMFFLLLTVVIIISHFNRRLNWEVIAPRQIGLRIGVLFLFMGLHILFVFLAGREVSTDDTLIVDVRRGTLALALIWGFCYATHYASLEWRSKMEAWPIIGRFLLHCGCYRFVVFMPILLIHLFLTRLYQVMLRFLAPPACSPSGATHGTCTRITSTSQYTKEKPIYHF